MKPSDLILELEVCLEADTVPYIEGPPGIGKSDIVHQLAEKVGRPLFDVRAALYEPTILQGMPVVINRKTGLPVLGHPDYLELPELITRFATFDFWPEDPEAIIFFDEFPSATPAQQAMYYQVLFGHKLGQITFPKTQRFMMAGNRMIDKAYVNPMSSANRSRICIIEQDVDFGDWKNWAVNKGIDAPTIFFHEFRAYQWLFRFDPQKDLKAFPCPRQWEQVAKDRKAAEKVFAGKPRPAFFEKVKGYVGEPAAADYVGFIEILDRIINPDLVILKPDTIEVPESPPVLMALCGALANKAKKENMKQIVTFLDRIPDEYSTLTMWTAGKRDPKIWQNEPAQKWMQSHPSVLNDLN
jgi:hypothetical protein